MRALVTGGTGFIGSHLVAALRSERHTVVCLVRRNVESQDQGIECLRADLSDHNHLSSLVNGIGPCDVVFHFGAILPTTPDRSPQALSHYLVVNVTATSMLLETAKLWKTRSFVYASSLPVIGKPIHLPVTEEHPARPEHPYLLSKYQAERICEFFRTKEWVSASSLRISSPYGEGMNQQTVLPLFVRLARESRDIPIYGTGHRTQNFVHVSDVVKAALMAAESNQPGVYNVAGKRSTSMVELARMVVAAVPQSKSRIRLTGEADPQDDYRWEVDLTKAAYGLGYRPEIDLSTGLKDYISILDREKIGRWWQPCE